MSTTVDERVVKMEFENKNFEKNAKKTINTINDLKKSLDFEDSAKSLDEVTKAAKDVDMSQLSKSVETVQARFSTMQVVAMTALSNITNSAIESSKKIISSLSFDQISAGWAKYNDKTSSVQTIMNATGKSIDEVNGYLDELMWYSDETSYGFTDMTSSLAQLTAAGGDIEKLIPMIMGVANATAFAGKGAAEFGRAIYNLNQSYSAGFLQYMDWKSLEMSGVASKQLKQTLIDAAVELGKISEGQIDINRFGQSLSSGWADKEVMEKAFGRWAEMTEQAYKLVNNKQFDTAAEAIAYLSGNYDELAESGFKAAQEAKTFGEAIGSVKDAVSSGWMKTAEIIFGDYEQAKKLWTDLANTLWDVFAGGAEKRNNILKDALSKSGWDDFIDQGIKDQDSYTWYVQRAAAKQGVAIDEIIEQNGSLEKAFANGSLDANLLSVALSDMTSTYAGLSDEELKSLGYTKEYIENLKDLNLKVQNGELSVNDLADSFNKISGRDLLIEGFKNALEGLIKVADSIKSAFSDVFGLDSDKIYSLVESFKNFTSKLIMTDETADKLKRTFRGLFAAIDTVLYIVKQTAKIVGKILGPAFKFLKDIILGASSSIGDFLWNLRNLVKGNGKAENSISNITNALSNFASTAKTFFGTVLSTAVKFFAAIGKYFTNFFNAIGNFFGDFSNILDKVWGLIKSIGRAIKTAFDYIIDTINNGGDNIQDVVNGLLGTGLTIGIAAIVKKLVGFLSNLLFDFKPLTQLFSEVLGDVSDALNAFTRNTNAKTLMKIALSITTLVASLIVLSTIDINKLKQALLTISALFIEIMVLMRSIMAKAKVKKGKNKELTQTKEFTKSTVNALQAIVGLGFTMMMFAKSLKMLSNLNPESLKVGLGALTACMTIMMASIVALNKILSTSKDDFKDEFKKIKELKKIAYSIYPLYGALLLLSTLKWEGAAVSLLAMGTSLSILIGSLLLINEIKMDKGIDKKVNEIGKLAWKLPAIGLALLPLSLFKWDRILPATLAMGSVVAGLCYVLKYLSSNIKAQKNTKTLLSLDEKIAELIKLSKSLLIVSISLLPLTFVKWEGIGKSLVGIIPVFATLVGVYTILNNMKGKQNDIDKKANALLSLSKSLLPVIASITLLSFIKPGRLVKGLAGVELCLISLIGNLYIISKISEKETKTIESRAKALRTICGTLLLLSSSIMLLGLLPWKKMLTGIGLMSLTLGILILALSALNSIDGKSGSNKKGILDPKKSKNIIKTASALLILAAALNLLVPVLVFMGMSLPIIVVGLAGFVGVLATLWVASKFVKPLIGMFNQFSNVSLKMAASVALLGVGIAALAVGLTILSSTVIAFTSTALTGLAALISTVIPVIVNSLLSMIPAITDGLLTMINGVLKGLAENIGDIAKYCFDIILGLFKELKSRWPEVLRNIWDLVITTLEFLADKIGELVEPLARIIVNTMDALVQAFSKIDAAEFSKFVSALTNLLSSMLLVVAIGATSLMFISALPKLLLTAVTFGKAITTFVKSIESVPTNKIEDAAKSGIAIAEMLNKLPTSGSLLKGSISKTVTTMAFVLAPFGYAISKFSDITSRIKKESLKVACESGILIAEMLNKMPSSGRFGKSDKVKTFKALKNNLVYFGLAIVGYVSVLPKSIADKAKISIDIGNKIAEMISAMPLTGGLFEADQSKTLESLKYNLEGFGYAVYKFAENTRGVTAEGIKPAIEATYLISDMLNSLPTSGGFVGFMDGDKTNSLYSLARNLGMFGESIKTFHDKTSGISISNIQNASNAGIMIGDFFDKLPRSGGLYDFMFGGNKGNTLKAFADNLGNFGSGLRQYYDQVEGIKDTSIMEQAAYTALKVCDALYSLGGINGELTGKSLDEYNTATSKIAKAINSLYDPIKDYDSNDLLLKTNAAVSVINTVRNIQGGLSVPENIDTIFGSIGSAISSFNTNCGTINDIEYLKNCALAGKDVLNIMSSIDCKSGLFKIDNPYKLEEIGRYYGSSIGEFYKNSVTENVDPNTIKDFALAGKELYKVMSETKPIKYGSDSMMNFYNASEYFGHGIKVFGEHATQFDSDSIIKIGSMILAGKSLIETMNSIEPSGGLFDAFSGSRSNTLERFYQIADYFGSGINAFSGYVSKLDSGGILKIGEAALAGKVLIGSMNSVEPTGGWFDAIRGSKSASLENFYKLAESFGKGINSFSNEVTNVNPIKCFAAISVGQQLINKMGELSSSANSLNENAINKFVSFFNTLGYSIKVFSENSEIVNSFKATIDKIVDIVNNGIDDNNLVIRPVLDLTNVRTGIDNMNAMLGSSPYIGAIGRAESINSIMNHNLDSSNADILLAIRDLSNKLDNMSSNTYNINGVTYDDGSNIQEAVKQIVRAARIERRI